jgi:ABC-type antimicrobial peptide transport system permease subunit
LSFSALTNGSPQVQGGCPASCAPCIHRSCAPGRLITAIAAISLVVGGIGIDNVMLVGVR